MGVEGVGHRAHPPKLYVLLFNMYFSRTKYPPEPPATRQTGPLTQPVPVNPTAASYHPRRPEMSMGIRFRGFACPTW